MVFSYDFTLAIKRHNCNIGINCNYAIDSPTRNHKESEKCLSEINTLYPEMEIGQFRVQAGNAHLLYTAPNNKPLMLPEPFPKTKGRSS
jgi:hypothetical protein